MKRIVFCFDGTWNRLAADCPTNVVLMAQMIKPVDHKGVAQIVYYDEGIGTDSKWNRLTAGAFGQGMLKILREAYRFLIFNYKAGDEIFAFGFSRGAYTARSFIGFIRHAGILDAVSASKIDRAIDIYRNAPAGTGEESEEGLRFRMENCTGVCVSDADLEFRKRELQGFDPAKSPILDIAYVGVWDTVRALGLPDFVPGSRWINGKYNFHDAVLTSKTKSARHAVALDEERPTFRATLFDNIAELNLKSGFDGNTRPDDDWDAPYQQRWFPGVHGAVGGGGSRRGLSDGAMAWILIGARKAGLEVRNENDELVFTLRPNPFDYLHNESTRTIWQRGLFATLRGLFHSPRKGPVMLEDLHRSVLLRHYAAAESLADVQPYRPGALKNATAAIARWPCADFIQTKSASAEYKVVKGDTMARIAEEHLGDAKRSPEIFAANRDRIDDPNYINIDDKLRIPIDMH